MKIKLILSLVLLLLLNCCNPRNNDEHYHGAMTSIVQKDFFSARDNFEMHKKNFNELQQCVISGILANAFNRLEESDAAINSALENGQGTLPDSVVMMLLEFKQDNAAKRYNYSVARDAVSTIISDHGASLPADELEDYENSLKLWTILQNVPPQQIISRKQFRAPMKKDLAGINNLTVFANGDSIDFLFDTGANLSTATKSLAEKMEMTVLPDSILVGTITGTKVYAQLAFCRKLAIGSVELANTVFLILDDKHLAFPQINYQINGILGFPIIEALQEITITKDGYFTVSEGSPSKAHDQNMALDHLSPLIRLDGKHYNFDTGANESMLYSRYFHEHQEHIKKSYEATSIEFGGAGGSATYSGYRIDFSATVSGKKVRLSNIPVLEEALDEKWKHIYGNLGQDLVSQFSNMTLNFKEMYIAFD